MIRGLPEPVCSLRIISHTRYTLPAYLHVSSTTNMPRYIHNKEYSGAVDRDGTSVGLVLSRNSASPSRPRNRKTSSLPRTPSPPQSLGTRALRMSQRRPRRNAVDLGSPHQQANSNQHEDAANTPSSHQQANSGQHDSGVNTPSPPLLPRNRTPSPPISMQGSFREDTYITVNYVELQDAQNAPPRRRYQDATEESIQGAWSAIRQQSEKQEKSKTVAEKKSKSKRLRRKCAKVWAKLKFPETWGPD
jgi:hypothetical protein